MIRQERNNSHHQHICKAIINVRICARDERYYYYRATNCAAAVSTTAPPPLKALRAQWKASTCVQQNWPNSWPFCVCFVLLAYIRNDEPLAYKAYSSRSTTQYGAIDLGFLFYWVDAVDNVDYSQHRRVTSGRRRRRKRRYIGYQYLSWLHAMAG